MNELQTAILFQAGGYFVTMLLAFVIISFIFRGFFWTYINVRVSFGRKIIVKLKGKLKDSFTAGWEEEGGELVYKIKKKRYVLTLPQKPVTYRALGVTWVDIDSEKNAFIFPDSSMIEGVDTVKMGYMIDRALHMPRIDDKKIMIVLFICIIIGLLAIGNLVFNIQIFQLLKNDLPTIKAGITALQKAGEVIPVQ